MMKISALWLQGFVRMAVEWREREHEEQDMISLNNQGTLEALRNCGLLKYFQLSSMQKQIELLQFLVCSWDPTNQTFHIRDKVIPFTIDDIYFMTRLSRRGAPISLSGFTRGGESVREYIRQFCREGAQPRRDRKINIRDVSDLPLRMILFTLSKLASRVTLHLENRSYIQYAL